MVFFRLIFFCELVSYLGICQLYVKAHIFETSFGIPCKQYTLSDTAVTKDT